VQRHGAGVEIVAATDIEADHKLDLLAGKEARLLPGGRHDRDNRKQRQR
jgi:hypothetical protein